MAALILPSRRVVQPQGPVEIDWSNPLARGLVSAINPAALRRNQIGVGSTLIVSGPAGMELRGNNARFITESTPAFGSAATILAICTWQTDVTSNSFPVSLGTNGAGNQLFGLQSSSASSRARAVIRTVNGGGVTTAESATIGPGFSDEGYLVRAAVYDGTSALKLYASGLDNTLSNANTAASGAMSSMDNFTLGGVNRGTDAFAVIGQNQSLGIAWNRALSPEEIRAVSENPWQLFRPIQRRIWVPVAGGAPAGVTGSLNATESGSDTALIAGQVIVRGALAATEVGSDTAAISGSSVIVTTGTLAATETGSDTAAITGNVLVQGTAAATETGADIAALSGGVLVTGLLSASEATSDTATVSGRVLVQGTLSAQEVGGDTADITNVVAIAPDEPLFVGEVEMRRWYVRRGKRLHIFDRAEDADAFLDAERQAADAVAQAQKTSRRARKRLRAKLALPEPVQTIDVDQLTRWAAEFNLDANLPALMARQDYASIEQLMAAAWAMQDERDVEELLLLL